jgi:hypothetical protein
VKIAGGSFKLNYAIQLIRNYPSCYVWFDRGFGYPLYLIDKRFDLYHRVVLE